MNDGDLSRRLRTMHDEYIRMNPDSASSLYLVAADRIDELSSERNVIDIVDQEGKLICRLDGEFAESIVRTGVANFINDALRLALLEHKGD